MYTELVQNEFQDNIPLRSNFGGPNSPLKFKGGRVGGGQSAQTLRFKAVRENCAEDKYA